jgi:maleylpyruvate isomerase
MPADATGASTTFRSIVADPDGLAKRVDAATARVLETAATLTDAQVLAPSPLPGWSRGHVLTHIARNADGLRNLLTWARTGVQTPQYPSQQARDDAIETGARRTAAELVTDIGTSADAFAAEAGSLAGPQWLVQVHGLRGSGHPAWYTLWRRLSEVEIHHVDLDAGYGPADWPADFVRDCFPKIAADFAGDQDCPAVRLTDSGSGTSYLIGPQAEPAATVTGPASSLLAWLIGRSDGADLGTDPAGQLPELPAW